MSSRTDSGELGSRTFLDQLLMATLQRAIALPQMNHVAVVVRQDLDLDVSRQLDVFFEIHAGIFESLFRFHRGCLQARLEGNVVAGDAHSFPAAAGRGLDQHRISDPGRDDQRLLLARPAGRRFPAPR